MAEQVTLDWLFSTPHAPGWYAQDSSATTISPCEPSQEPLIEELHALRADVASLVAALDAVTDCWIRFLAVQERNAVPPEVWAQLESIVRRRRARGV
ncbi:MAG TPA: hypothetical protein VK524_25565 [Polyangiaceae bacterium]|nr:hypothetical protein [Polyangiaceae bacterium]